MTKGARSSHSGIYWQTSWRFIGATGAQRFNSEREIRQRSLSGCRRYLRTFKRFRPKTPKGR